jgi:hypothetical protein
MFGGSRIEIGSRRPTRVGELHMVAAAAARDGCPGWNASRAPGDRFLELRHRKGALDTPRLVAGIHPGPGVMDVRVEQPRDDGAPLQIDDGRSGGGFSSRIDARDPPAPDDERRSDDAAPVNELAVHEREIFLPCVSPRRCLPGRRCCGSKRMWQNATAEEQRRPLHQGSPSDHEFTLAEQHNRE